MKKPMLTFAALCLAIHLSGLPIAFAETADEFFQKGQAAYNNGQLQQALEYFQQATTADEHFLDAYFNQGAIYYNQKRYSDALQAFNKLLQQDPGDMTTRYETGRVFEKMGRLDEAIAAFEMIGPASSRHARAQENIARLKALKSNLTQTTANTTKTPANKPDPKPQPIAANTASAKPVVQEFVGGFSGPTGLTVDSKGNLYVANFSKNTIYKVSASGDKKIMASGEGINGPVGMTMDSRTGELYIANHLDNTVSKISPDGKVSVIATGLKKPYNLFLDEHQRMLYVSQQETNSVAKIKLR